MLTAKQAHQFVLRLLDNNDKAKPAERRARKATGPRFLREAMDDFPKDPRPPSCRIATGGRDCSEVLCEEVTQMNKLSTQLAIVGTA